MTHTSRMDSARIPYGVGLYLRQLPVECANHVIGPRGKDSALRRWDSAWEREVAVMHAEGRSCR